MPITVTKGLSTLDRSLFSFRKTDRVSRSSTPVGNTSKGDEVESAPELPPLGTWNSNNSFANLVNCLDKASQSSVAVLPNTSIDLDCVKAPETLNNSSSETVQQHDTKSTRLKESMDSTTTSNYFTALEMSPSKNIPGRQQSSTSTTSMSKRSTTFSTGSISSRSSVEDMPVKPVLQIKTDTVTDQQSSTDFLATGFSDIQLDLDFNSDFVNNRTRLSEEFRDTDDIPTTWNTNKPLPLAPSATARASNIIMYGVPLPELDSAPVPTNITTQSNTRHTKLVPGRSEVKRSTLVPQLSIPYLAKQNEAPTELAAPSSVRSKLRQEASRPRKSKSINSDTAERVILGILSSSSSILDLRATAMINKGFYRVFRRHESEIVQNVLYHESPPAWELRNLVAHEQKRNPFQMKAIQRDIAALRALQAFVLMKCDKICRKSTLDGLMGHDKQRQSDVEDALWRIWTFCKLFGKGTSHNTGVHDHITWLEGNLITQKGIKSGPQSRNGTAGASMSELEDMSEMWCCMETLLFGFKGREVEAREAGIFDQCKIDDKSGQTESHYLDDWIYDVLSVGPKAVLTMISCSFEHAKMLGVNKWTPPRPGKSRRTFFKAALEQVYRDRLVDEARNKAEMFARSMQKQAQSRPSSSYDRPSTKAQRQPSPIVHRPQSAAAVMQPIKIEEKSVPLEIRPDCDPQAFLPSSEPQGPVVSPTTNPAAFSSLAMTSKASARMGATLFPLQAITAPQAQASATRLGSADSSISSDTGTTPPRKVVDPTDRALALLVKQLGFPENVAKQALAMSDDGAGIDVQRAVELLSEDRRLEVPVRPKPIVELPDNNSNILVKPTPGIQQFRDYCEGTCRRVSLMHRKKSNLRGLLKRDSVRQSFPLSAIMDHEEEDGAVHQLTGHAVAPVVSTILPAEEKAPSLIGSRNISEFMRYRNSIRVSSNLGNHREYVKGHKKSSSTGTIDISDEGSQRSTSPISPITPALSLGGFTAIGTQLQQIYENDTQAIHQPNKPKVTLTRVGTGKRPSNRIGLRRNSSRRTGEPPEIIGYTY